MKTTTEEDNHRKMEASKVFMIVGLLAVMCAVSFILGRWTKKDPEPKIVTKSDTVTIWRTETKLMPEPSFKIDLPPFLVFHDELDTLVLHDTTYLEIPMEQKVYKDTNYTAYVSGFRPQLDSLTIRIPTTYIETTTTIRKPAPRWSFGIQAGFGAQYGIVNKTADFGPYVGIGVTYRILPINR